MVKQCCFMKLYNLEIVYTLDHRDNTKKENNKAVFDGVGWNCNLGIVHTIPTIRSS